MPTRGRSVLGEDWGDLGSEQGSHENGQEDDPGPCSSGDSRESYWVHAFHPGQGQLTEAVQMRHRCFRIRHRHNTGIVRGVAE